MAMMKLYCFLLSLAMVACKTVENNTPNHLDMIKKQVENIIDNPPKDSGGWAMALLALGITTVIAVPLYLFQSSKNSHISTTSKFLHGVEQQQKKG